jgi:hypothetical protein
MASLCPLRRLTCPQRIEREQQPIQYHEGAVDQAASFVCLRGIEREILDCLSYIMVYI